MVVAATGCDREADRQVPTGRGPAAPPPSVESTTPARGPLVVFLGDSLTAGFGLAQDEAFPAVVARLLRADGIELRVVNAGVSGDTSAGGLRRLDWVLEQEPDVIVVGLGANDALRGQPIDELERNLRQIVIQARARGAAVLLLGMRIPTSYGPDYAEAFAAVYPAVARDTGVPLVPFLLEGVGGRPSLNQPDGVHPTARGQEIVARNVAPSLAELVRSLR